MSKWNQSEAWLASVRAGRRWAVLGRLELLGAVRCSGLEAVAAGVFFSALAFGVFGVHVARGGLMFDDWTLAYDVHHSLEVHGLFGAFNDLLTGNVLTGKSPGRPVEVAYNVLLYAAFGRHAALHLAAAILIAALVAFLFYIVLRWLGVERLHAGAIATFVLLFPASDSTVFWATGAIAHVTVALYLMGTICALRGLRSRGGSMIAWNVLAIAFYSASILQYQIAAPFVFLSVFVYRLSGASWRRSITVWLGSAIFGLVALAYAGAHIGRRSGSLSEDWRHARDIGGGARRLLGSLGVQDGPQFFPTIAMVVLLLVAGAAVLLLPAGDAVRAGLRRWLCIAIAGFVTIAAAYAIFIPGDFYYWPLRQGIGNRVNGAAALGFALVIYSLAVLVALLFTRAFSLDAALRTAAGIAFVAAVALSASFISTINSDRRPYERAATLQWHALAVVKDDVARPPPRTTVYLFGVAGEIAPNIFTFVRPQDVTAALRLIWNENTIEGVPAASTEAAWPGNTPSNSGIGCGASSLQPHGWLFSKYPPSPYGRTVFVDVLTRTSELIRNRESCLAEVSHMRSG